MLEGLTIIHQEGTSNITRPTTHFHQVCEHDADSESITAIILFDTALTINEEKAGNDHATLTLTYPKCQDYLVILSAKISWPSGKKPAMREVICPAKRLIRS